MTYATTRGLDGFAKDAESQAAFFDRVGIDVYAGLLRSIVSLVAANDDVRARFEEAWRDREFQSVFARPLLLCGALRRDALVERDHPLRAALGPSGDPKMTISREALVEALAAGRPVFATLRVRSNQTNEISRAAVWRLPASRPWGRRHLALIDCGCSAGLHLVADRIALSWTDAVTGEEVGLPSHSEVVTRVGLDRRPIDARSEEEATWLRACVWPGQLERLAQLDAALAAASKALHSSEMKTLAVDAAEMPAWIDGFAREHEGVDILAYQSTFIEYLSPSMRERYESEMTARVKSYGGRLLWVEFERSAAPVGPAGGPMAIRAHVASQDGVSTHVLATADYHPRALWLDRNAIAELDRDLGRQRGAS